MASSMLAGERRWASARRGGMTVLGKVAVPKPFNLPSQRLENHGLDPNVEIVPKGTLSWGNRSSSSASNAWSSSMQSPNADGGTSSPSHLSARPSSSGSCTRPSTAGSDRAHEPTANAWTPNSRPSSASGILASNQTSSTSLRPRSAETRPNSSQLSRFAEPVSESSVAWGPTSAVGRLGVKSSKEDGFSLSSGDFPTLGSDRDNSVKDIELQEHVFHEHPSSASGRISQTDGKITTPQDVIKSGTNNTWKRDGTRSPEDGIHPSMDKWQGEPQQYYHSTVPPQQFDSWRGPPINAPPGAWYRGPPGGPPFGAPVAPGGFPMEPFPYHRPQVVPMPLAGSQTVPPPGAAPRGPRPKNGDLYRTQMPDAYAHPAMPFRPGFYPGPMTFDNYYRPPMGYCNGNEREIPYMGMAAGHPVFNRYPAPSALDPSYSPGRADGRGSSGKALSENMEADHLEGPRGPHNIPLKNQKEWDRKEEGENCEQNLRSSASHRGKHGLPLISSRKTEWGADDDVEEDIFGEQTTPHENTSHNFGSHSTDTIKVKSLKGIGNVKAVNDNWTEKSDIVACFPPEQSQRTPASDRDTSLLAPTKDPALMQKIEVLNAKARATDGRHDVPAAYNREEQRSGFQVVEANFNNSTVEAGSTAGSFERTSTSGDFVPVPHEVVVPVGDKMSRSGALVSRRAYYGGQGRVDHRSKGKFNSLDDDGWQKKLDVITASNIESSYDIHACRSEDIENSVIRLAMNEGQPCADSYDSTDIQAQRAKMRETAKQRALQLQKEEEERMREQKAKALAKLEELNRRTQAGEAGNQKAERAQGTQNAETAMGIGVFQGEQKETHSLAEQEMVNHKLQAPGPTLVSESDRESSTSHDRHDGQAANISRDLLMETPWISQLEHISHGQCLPLKQDSYNAGATNAFESTDESVSRHKQIICKQKPNDPSQKNSDEKSSLIVTGEASKDLTDVYVNHITLMEVASSVRVSGETNAPNTSNIMAEPTTHQRRTSNRYSKNKQRVDEAAVISPIPSVTLEETNPAKESVETGKSKVVLLDLDSSVSAKIEPDGGVQASEVQPTFHDAVHSRVSKQGKPQSRKMPRTLQANRIVEKYHSNDTTMWAPVQSQSKVEVAVEASKKSSTECATSSKIDNQVQNSSKGKRAEMERYVPKPVAKELAQQGSIQSVPFSTSTTPEEAAGRAQPESSKSASPPPNRSATGIVGSGVDFKEGDGRHNKQGKAHGTWRHRNFTESSNRKSAHHGPSIFSNPSKDIQGSTDQNQIVKHEVNALKAEFHISRDNSSLDSSNMSTDIESAAAGKSLAVKDQRTTGRGKRYLSKGHKSMGNNNDPEHTNTVSSESVATDVNQTDRTISSKGSHSSGERMSSHWQPKPNTYSENNQNRGRSAGTGTINVETDRSSKRDNRPQRKVHVPPQDDKKSFEGDRPHPDYSVPESNMADEPNVGHHQELFRERKTAPAKGHPYSPSKVPVGVGESAPAVAYTAVENDPNFSSGFKRNGNHNNRSGRGHESHGDWSSGHDSRQHNVTAFRERQRQNVHYEYQPVGQYKNSKTEKLVESGDGSNDVAPRYRERNQSHSKRDGGNFHRRQGGPARVDSGHG